MCEGVINQLSLEMSKEIRRTGREKKTEGWVWLLKGTNLSEVRHLGAQQGTEEGLFLVLQLL